MYKRNLSFVEESDAQIAAIQLRRGKTLLDDSQIKKRSKSTPHAPRARIEPSEQSTSTPNTNHVPETQDIHLDTESNEESYSSSMITSLEIIFEMIFDISSRLSLTTFSIAQYIQSIIEEYNNDIQFKMTLKTGIESDIYVLKHELLYIDFDKNQFCILNIQVKEKRNDDNKSLHEMLITHSHEIINHHDEFATQNDI